MSQIAYICGSVFFIVAAGCLIYLCKVARNYVNNIAVQNALDFVQISLTPPANEQDQEECSSAGSSD